ncbi:hypothetical protein A2U01_0050867, partial [Trifolium medium]|nr:hypothetical protein [Trifolium medium]
KWLRFSMLPLLKTVRFQIVAGLNRYQKKDRCLSFSTDYQAMPFTTRRLSEQWSQRVV